MKGLRIAISVGLAVTILLHSVATLAAEKDKEYTTTNRDGGREQVDPTQDK